MKTIPLALALSVSLSSAWAQTPPAPAPAPAPKPAEQKPAEQKPAAQKPAEPKPAAGEGAQPAAASENFTAEQLEQIVAPIALHPDSLLSQILMASTYPIEIVEASRWLQKNPKLKGKELEEALKKQDWDPAVKSMCGLPDVLHKMNDNLDWTQDLGDAFLGQKEELMKTVQKMRKKALEAGNLKSGEQQTVKTEGDVIIIESTKTEVVYVPTYYPSAVYGGWGYPYYSYPPMYPPYPAGGLLFAFSIGVAWGGCWGGCNWGGNDVYINHNEFNNFNKNTSINGGRDNLPGGGRDSFKHNPEHRKGANYKSPKTAQQFGANKGSNRVSNDQARGRNPSGSKAGPSAGTRPAGGAAQRPSAGASQRPAGGNSGAAPRPLPTTSPSRSALSGSRSPSADRSASARGSASRGSSSGGARGGASRGGRGGGGGGRRR